MKFGKIRDFDNYWWFFKHCGIVLENEKIDDLVEKTKGDY